MLRLPVAMLSIRLVLYGFILYGDSYYVVVAGILVPSAASCTIIHRVKLVGSLIPQPFRLE